MSKSPSFLSPTALTTLATPATIITAAITPATIATVPTISATNITPQTLFTAPPAPNFISTAETLLGKTPTVTQLLDASVAVITTAINPLTGPLTMGDLSNFNIGGTQLIDQDLTSGLLGAAYLTPEHQVIVAFEATTGFTSTGSSSSFYQAQINADVDQTVFNTPTTSDLEAVAFAQQVVQDAAKHGIGAGNVFVTGFSLGAQEAEYTAQQTGLPGIGFEGTGLPQTTSAAGTGKNFVDVVTYGDPVANLASDINADQPISGPYVPGGGVDPHYGQELFIGNPTDQSYITSSLAPYAAAIAASKANGTELAYYSSFASTFLNIATPYHNPFTTAGDLGTSLPLGTELVTGLGAASHVSGPVTPVANDTIPQLLAYIAAHQGLA